MVAKSPTGAELFTIIAQPSSGGWKVTGVGYLLESCWGTLTGLHR